MILTDEEKQQVREMFYLSEETLFDVYHQMGTNLQLVKIDAHNQFESLPTNIKSSIKQGKLIVVIIKETNEESYVLLQDATLQEGLGN